jgi:glycosyltransferase involved in cell wall biosynthesis
MFIRALQGRGHPVAGLDIDRPDGVEAGRLTGIPMASHARDLPYERSLVIASMHQLPKIWLGFGKAIRSPARRFVGLVFWELPTIPSAWLSSLRMFDALLTCSTFVRQAVASAVPELPVLHAEHPLAPMADAPDRASVRSAYGIPNDSVAFWCTFDPRSGLPRKNPAGTIRAFLEAFPERSDVCLVVKSNGPASDEDLGKSGVPLSIRNDARVIWLESYLPHDALMHLFASCDVFVSLHRSEGLGLVPMEAMSLGKLVIATGYSGNMTYMNEHNSMAVPYRMVEASDEIHFITRRFVGPGALWADPDVASAAAMMRSVLELPDAARRLAARARDDIAARQKEAWRAEWLDQLVPVLDRSERYRSRGALRSRLLASEVLDATLLRRNARAALRWLQRRLA